MRNPKVILSIIATPILLVVLWVWFAPAPYFGVSTSFAGYTTNAAGSRLAHFAITNAGNTTVRRWDFCEISTQLPGRPVELHIGPDAYLKAGTSEVIVLPSAMTQSVWRATLYFTHDDWRRTLNDNVGRFPFVRRLIPEKFHNLPVEHHVNTDWIKE